MNKAKFDMEREDVKRQIDGIKDNIMRRNRDRESKFKNASNDLFSLLEEFSHHSWSALAIAPGYFIRNFHACMDKVYTNPKNFKPFVEGKRNLEVVNAESEMTFLFINDLPGSVFNDILEKMESLAGDIRDHLMDRYIDEREELSKIYSNMQEMDKI